MSPPTRLLNLFVRRWKNSAFRDWLCWCPGTASRSGYLTLGILIHRVTGEFYGDFLQQRIFKPLKMSTTRIINEADIVPNRAAGYRLDKGDLKNQEWVSSSVNTTADGSLYFGTHCGWRGEDLPFKESGALKLSVTFERAPGPGCDIPETHRHADRARGLRTVRRACARSAGGVILPPLGRGLRSRESSPAAAYASSDTPWSAAAGWPIAPPRQSPSRRSPRSRQLSQDPLAHRCRTRHWQRAAAGYTAGARRPAGRHRDRLCSRKP